MPGAACPWMYTWSPGRPSSLPRKKWLKPTSYSAAELAKVDQDLGDPSLYEAQNAARFDQLTKRRKDLPDELAALYARWEELEAIAEQAG